VVAGVQRRDLPRDPPPGRGVLAGEGRELQVVLPPPELLASAAAVPQGPRAAPPWRHRPLPSVVLRHDLDPDSCPGLLLGAAGPHAAGCGWDPATTAGRLLVTGPPRSGRTTTLRALAESAVEDGRAVAIVAVSTGGRRGPEQPGVTVLGPDDVEALVDLRHENPRLVVLVDDADRLDDAPVRPVVSEIADLAARDDGVVFVATPTSALAARFRGLDVDTARYGCGVVLSPHPGDGEVLGIRPRPDPTRRPGRGLLVVHGEARTVQVLMPQSDAGRSSSSSGS
jgi:DNA segregation ATPase FtsK/SpoIIIE, S-DNA-T family